jgi:farnesyl-diphosphate farnesyltransferase
MLQPSLNELLKQTSRSFYLTLRVLPAAVRPQIGLAYLLARTTDTIADTEIVSVAQRLAALQQLRGRILGTYDTPLNLGALAQPQGLPAERALLERVEESLALLEHSNPGDLPLIRKVLDTITSGQELDLQRFAGASGEHLIALRSDGELDDYTYRVAGCVGEFWTKMCRAHLFPDARLEDKAFLANAVRFGKGLQLVNILRDLPADLRKGRCYLPTDKLSEAGLRPDDLLQPATEEKLRPLYHHYLDLAEAHLAAGWVYTNAVPRGQVRVRLACAWPILIGLRTLRRLRTERILNLERRVKISRSEVRRVMVQSVLCYPWPAAWHRLFSTAAPAARKPEGTKDASD